jgi:hypothetical protein
MVRREDLAVSVSQVCSLESFDMDSNHRASIEPGRFNVLFEWVIDGWDRAVLLASAAGASGTFRHPVALLAEAIESGVPPAHGRGT